MASELTLAGGDCDDCGWASSMRMHRAPAITLSIDVLAKAARLSPRQFSRVFRAETGQSPAKAVENLRLESARWLLEQTAHSIDEVAQESGFADRRPMREVFLRAFGQPPQVIRRQARSETTRASN